MFLHQEDARQWFIRTGALAYYRGNPEFPHFLLTSGRHSDGFCNCDRLLQWPYLLDRACSALVDKLRGKGLKVGDVNCVVGPAMGAVTIGNDVARHVALFSGREMSCQFVYAMKDPDDPVEHKPRMIFPRMQPRAKAKVLLVEDTCTTGGSLRRTADAVLEAGGSIVPYIATLVNRSGLKEIDGRQIISLLDVDIPSYAPEDCPICAEGSVAIAPKVKGNWKLLTGED